MENLPHLRRRFRKGRSPFYEVICTCGAYSYPHRFGGGYCNGVPIVEFFWEKRMCGDCNLAECGDWEHGPSCQVLAGREDIAECGQLQEFLRANEAYSKRLPRR